MYKIGFSAFLETIEWGVMQACLRQAAYKTAPLLIFILPVLVAAQEQCGSIIEPVPDGEPTITPIENCNNPFNEDAPSERKFTSTFTFDGIEIEDEATVQVEDTEVSHELSYSLDGNPFVASLHLYRHEGSDFRKVDEAFRQTLTRHFATGTYSAIATIENDTPVLSENRYFDRIIEWVFPRAYAFYPDYKEVHVLTFTIEATAPEPKIDPLILEYAPTLYFHPDEDYFPMNVEAFIEASALWDQSGIDEQLRTAKALTVEEFESVVDNQDTEDFYLAFSDPDEAKSIDLQASKAKYDDLLASEAATTTMYYRKMEDSFTDVNGELQEYIVLQYWFFYAMNNWGEQGGFNNHEGDWESVFVFLDKETEEPRYVAFSAHHNDGDDSDNVLQYDSVRRDWNDSEIKKQNKSVASFVALGSHATYPKKGEVTINILNEEYIDFVSANGRVAQLSGLTEMSQQKWINYKGRWGADRLDIVNEKSGPQGPKYLDVSGHIRYQEPIEWAGIDAIAKKVIDDPTDTVTLPDQKISFTFSELLEKGTELNVIPVFEPINFGDIAESVTTLPNYWDITSSLENGTFDVSVTLSYEQEVVDLLEGTEANLKALFYNSDTEEWEVLDSTVDESEDTVTFTTDHFSRYALGIVEPTLEDLFGRLRTEIDNTNLWPFHKKFLKKNVAAIERLALKERSFTTRAAVRLLDNLASRVSRLSKWGMVSNEASDRIRQVIEEIKSKL